jgi:CheY-like chemotaxis protein
VNDQEASQAGAAPAAAGVLLVEDNFLIALDTSEMLRELGVSPIWTAVNTVEALEMIEKHKLLFAFLDVNLGEEKGFEIAARLRPLGIPFAFATGYGGQSPVFPAEFVDAPVIQKPYRSEHLAAVLSAHGLIEPEPGAA